MNPLVEGYSPLLHLALFSPRLAQPQVDWPRQTVVTGFPFRDADSEAGLAPELIKFLDGGPPPIIFTLGRSSATVAGPFFEQSASAAQRLGQRAVLIVDDPRNRPSSTPEGVVAFEYAPFSTLFPRARAIVHHGGVGTMGLAMRSGLPMLVVPRAHDQPDNAARASRLGIARSIPADAIQQTAPWWSSTDCSLIRSLPGGRRKSVRRCGRKMAWGWRVMRSRG